MDFISKLLHIGPTGGERSQAPSQSGKGLRNPPEKASGVQSPASKNLEKSVSKQTLSSDSCSFNSALQSSDTTATAEYDSAGESEFVLAPEPLNVTPLAHCLDDLHIGTPQLASHSPHDCSLFAVKFAKLSPVDSEDVSSEADLSVVESEQEEISLSGILNLSEISNDDTTVGFATPRGIQASLENFRNTCLSACKNPVELLEDPFNVIESHLQAEGRLNDTSLPLNDTHLLVNDTSLPLNDTHLPVNDTSLPVNDTSRPPNDTSLPVNDTSRPLNDTSLPVNDTSLPVNDTSRPLNDTSLPVNDTSPPLNNSRSFSGIPDLSSGVSYEEISITGITPLGFLAAAENFENRQRVAGGLCIEDYFSDEDLIEDQSRPEDIAEVDVGVVNEKRTTGVEVRDLVGNRSLVKEVSGEEALSPIVSTASNVTELHEKGNKSLVNQVSGEEVHCPLGSTGSNVTAVDVNGLIENKPVVEEALSEELNILQRTYAEKTLEVKSSNVSRPLESNAENNLSVNELDATVLIEDKSPEVANVKFDTSLKSTSENTVTELDDEGLIEDKSPVKEVVIENLNNPQGSTVDKTVAGENRSDEKCLIENKKSPTKNVAGEVCNSPQKNSVPNVANSPLIETKSPALKLQLPVVDCEPSTSPAISESLQQNVEVEIVEKLSKEGTSLPVYDTSRPLNDTSLPVNDTSRPLNDTSLPVNDTSRPLNDTSRPLNDTSLPVNDTSRPVNDTSRPLNDTSLPVNDTSRSLNDTVLSYREKSANTVKNLNKSLESTVQQEADSCNNPSIIPDEVAIVSSVIGKFSNLDLDEHIEGTEAKLESFERNPGVVTEVPLCSVDDTNLLQSVKGVTVESDSDLSTVSPLKKSEDLKVDAILKVASPSDFGNNVDSPANVSISKELSVAITNDLTETVISDLLAKADDFSSLELKTSEAIPKLDEIKTDDIAATKLNASVEASASCDTDLNADIVASNNLDKELSVSVVASPNPDQESNANVVTLPNLDTKLNSSIVESIADLQSPVIENFNQESIVGNREGELNASLSSLDESLPLLDAIDESFEARTEVTFENFDTGLKSCVNEPFSTKFCVANLNNSTDSNEVLQKSKEVLDNTTSEEVKTGLFEDCLNQAPSNVPLNANLTNSTDLVHKSEEVLDNTPSKEAKTDVFENSVNPALVKAEETPIDDLKNNNSTPVKSEDTAPKSIGITPPNSVNNTPKAEGTSVDIKAATENLNNSLSRKLDYLSQEVEVASVDIKAATENLNNSLPRKLDYLSESQPAEAPREGLEKDALEEAFEKFSLEVRGDLLRKNLEAEASKSPKNTFQVGSTGLDLSFSNRFQDNVVGVVSKSVSLVSSDENKSVEEDSQLKGRSVEEEKPVEERKSVEEKKLVEEKKSVDEDNQLKSSVEEKKSVEEKRSVEEKKSVDEDNQLKKTSVEERKSVEEKRSVDEKKSFEEVNQLKERSVEENKSVDVDIQLKKKSVEENLFVEVDSETGLSSEKSKPVPADFLEPITEEAKNNGNFGELNFDESLTEQALNLSREILMSCEDQMSDNFSVEMAAPVTSSGPKSNRVSVDSNGIGNHDADLDKTFEKKSESPTYDSTVNNSEAGPITAEEEFNIPASAFQFDLDSLPCGERNPRVTRANLTRNSLYVKFDPIVGKILANTETNNSPVHLPQTLQELDLEKTPMKNPALDEKLISITPYSAVGSGDANTSISEQLDSSIDSVSNKTIANATLNKTDPDITQCVKNLSFDAESKQSSSSVTSQTNKLQTSKTTPRGTVVSQEYYLKELEKLQDLMSKQELGYQEELKRNTEKMEKLQLELSTLKKEVHSKTKALSQSDVVLGEYERTISQLVAQNEADKKQFEVVKEKLIQERDTVTVHLNNTEIAFNDVHQKYERSKTVIEDMKNIQDKLKASNEEFGVLVKAQEDRYNKLKTHVAAQLDKANVEMETMVRTHQAENDKLTARLKQAELAIKSLENSNEQKSKEIKELTQILDELIGKVGADGV